jgi:hypothetical protein
MLCTTWLTVEPGVFASNEGAGMKNSLGMAVVLLMTTFSISNANALEYEGAGLQLCSAFTQDMRKDPKFGEVFYFSWAEGYMSGVNVAKWNDQHAFRSMPANQQREFIQDYCNKNPNDKFFKAVYSLYLTLYPKVDEKSDGLGNVQLDGK